MWRLAGRTRMARKWLVMAASGLPLLVLVPRRQVTGRTWAAWARARVRRVAGGGGEAGLGGGARPPAGLGRGAAPAPRAGGPPLAPPADRPPAARGRRPDARGSAC